MSELNGQRRFEVKMEEELYKRFSYLIDHGLRQRAVNNIIEIMCSSLEMAKADGNDAVIFGAILAGQLRFEYHPTARQPLAPTGKKNEK